MDLRTEIEKRVAKLKAYAKDYDERVPMSEAEEMYFNGKAEAYNYAAVLLQRDLDFFEVGQFKRKNEP